MRHDADAEQAHAHGKFQNGLGAAHLRPDFILHAILDFVVDAYFPVVQLVMDEVLAMEQHLQDELLDRQEITRLFHLRREAIHFQHVISRMSDICGKLTYLDVPCISAEVRPYFRDVHAHLMRLDAMVSGLVEAIRTVFEASSLLELQRQGIITRQLAAWAAILGVPAAIAGVYSMNSANMAELQGTYGYPAVVAVMLAICVALYIRFKKLRWL